MLMFFLRRQPGAPIQLSLETVMRDTEPDMPERLNDFNAEWTAFGLVSRAKLPRGAQVVLLPIDDSDDTAIDDIHVLIDAHGELQRGAALAVGRREPQPVEE